MLKLLDNTEKIKREIETLEDPCWHEKLNGLNVLEFTTLDRDIKNKDRIVFQDELGVWHEFIVESIDDTHEDVFVYCEDSFYETRGDYIDDRRFVNANFSTVANAVMSHTRWNFKISGDLGKGTVNFYRTSVKSAVFEDMQNKFNFEIKTYVEITNSRISQRVIELRKQRGHDNGKRFTYDKDIDSISRTIDSMEFCTALYAYGKGEETENGGYGRRIDISKVNDGKKYVENLKAKEQFGKYVNGKREHIFGTYIFEEIDDRRELMRQARKKLHELSEFKVTYKCDVLVLNKLLEDRQHEGIELGDTVAIIDKDINIRIRARVVERKSYLNSTKADEIVLGNFIEDYATQQAKIKSDLKSISNTINEQGQAITDLKNFDYYATIVQELNDRIIATGGYVYISKDGQGLITYDKPIDKNPTKAIQLRGGAIRIANSKKSDGSWNWTTFGTGDGFTADKIIAGILQGGKVRWNLEDGTFLIGNSISDYSFYWDGSTLHMKDVDIDLTNNSVVKNMNQNIDKNNEDIKKANDVITQTQTSVQVLKDSISSKVSKTEILSDKEIQNALKGRDGTDGADGSNFTWNLLLKSNELVKNSLYKIMEYSIADKPVVDETYTLTIWGNLSEGKKYFYAYNSNAYVNLIALTEVEDGIYTGQFKWRDTLTYGSQVHTADNSKLLIYVFESNVISESTINKIKLEKGVNDNPVWSPHYSEIKGEKGDRGEQGIRGLQGRDGRDGIQGKDGVSSFTHIAYSNSADGSKDFSTSNSNREYIGIYVDSNKTDSEDYKSYKWSKIKGLDGKNGIAGKNGVGIKSTDISYGLSNSETKEPTSWTKAVPNLIKGKYLWTKTVWKYTDNTSETGYTKTYIAKDGNTGKNGIAGKDGVGIKSTTITYAKSKSGTSAPTSGWTSKVPSTSSGDFLWTKMVWNYTDNTSETGYSVSKIGKDGTQGIPGKAGADGKTPYLHIAYSNSQDGSKDFSVTDSNRAYIGTYTDFSKADSTDYKKYSWSKIKGEFEGEIGGRNLIRNSDKITGWTKYDGGNHLITDEYMEEFNIQGQHIRSDAANATDFIKTYVNLDVDDLVVGKTYTFSVYVKNNRDVTAGLRVNGFNWDFSYSLNANECKRFVVTGKRDSMDGYWKNRIQLQLRSANKGQFVDMTVSRPQLEEGDVATSWKPNPLDLISETQTVKRTFEAYKEQTDKALTDKVSIKSYNSKNEEIQSQISSIVQNATSITQRVSNLNKYLDDKISTITQTTDSIKLSVSSKLGETEVQSLIKQTVEKITIKASQIDFSGNVSITGELRTKYYSGNTALWMKNDSLKAYEDNTYNNEIGYFGGRAWSDEAYPYHLSISHGMDYHTTISYEGSSNYHPYILFDAYNNVDPSFVDSSGNATIRKHQYDPVGGIKYMMRELHTERNYFTDKVFHQDHVWVQKDLYFGNGVGIERAGRDDYVVFGKMSQLGGVASGGLRFMNNGRVYTEGSVFVNNEIRWNANYPIFFGNGYGVQLTNSYIAIGRITSDGTVTDGIYIEGTELRALRDNKLGATLN